MIMKCNRSFFVLNIINYICYENVALENSQILRTMHLNNLKLHKLNLIFKNLKCCFES